MTSGARETALRALRLFRLKNMRSDEALNTAIYNDARNTPDARDAALASRIFYGVIQNRLFLDGCLAVYSAVKPHRLQPQVLDILRLSVYQLLFLSKIPVNAAVSEGVALARRHANPRAAGLVNAVLRRIAENGESLLAEEGEKTVSSLSGRYSHPEWLVDEFAGRLGLPETEALLQANNEPAPVTVRVNTLRTDARQAAQSLEADGADVRAHWLEGSLELFNARRPDRLQAFLNGGIYVQDPAAALAVLAAEPEPGMLIIDGCAAPGGKSVTAAVLTQGAARIIACDVADVKLQRIHENMIRTGIACVETRIMDAREPGGDLTDKADIVLADVPCSGFGVIRKKPEIRYKTPEETEGLPDLQLAVLRGLSRCVKPGGLLIYSTCTLLRRENEEVVTAFLEDNPGFFPEAFRLPAPAGDAGGGMLTLWPHRHMTDGFFIARLRRRLHP